MYKFSNGIVVFDKATAEEFIKNGYKLIEQPIKKKEIRNDQDNDESIIKKDTRNNKQIAKHK